MRIVVLDSLADDMLTSIMPAILFEFHLQQFFTLLFEFKRENRKWIAWINIPVTSSNLLSFRLKMGVVLYNLLFHVSSIFIAKISETSESRTLDLLYEALPARACAITRDNNVLFLLCLLMLYLLGINTCFY